MRRGDTRDGMATPDPGTLEKLLASPDVVREMFELTPRGYERYSVGWLNVGRLTLDVFDPLAGFDEGVTIDGECIELGGLLEPPA